MTPQIAETVLAEICTEYGVSVEALRSARRGDGLPIARKLATHRLIEAGCSERDAARALEKHRTTILFHLKSEP